MKNKSILNLILVAVVILSAIPAGLITVTKGNSISSADGPATTVEYNESYKTGYYQTSDYAKTAATGNIVKKNGVIVAQEYKTVIDVKPTMSNGLSINCSLTLGNDSVYYSGNNLFRLSVNGTSSIVYKGLESLTWDPQLFIGNKEVFAKSSSPALIREDPLDKNYHNNTLEWDYGVCIRHLRVTEGMIYDSWIFSADPRNFVQIVDNSKMSQGFTWSLDPFAYDADYNFIPITSDKIVSAKDMKSAKYPVTIDPTTQYTATSSTGCVYTINANYNTGWTNSTGTVNYVLSDIGQTLSSGSYYIYRSCVFYQTGIIPDDAVISAANVSISCSGNFSTTDFTIQVQNGQPTYPHDPLVVGDYDKSNYSGYGSTDGVNTSNYASRMNISLNSTGISWINLSGTTKLCLRSDRDINGTTPAGAEYIITTTTSGYLEVTYTTATTTQTYTTIGTFNWTVPSCVTSVKVLVVAGGGGGGGAYGVLFGTRRMGGGGGGGGIVYNTSYSVTPGANVSFTIGDGGTGGVYNVNGAAGYNGSNSVFGSITATGGGGGGGSPNGNGDANLQGRNGGCGGGEGVGSAADGASAGTGSQGYNGGLNYYSATAANRGGGGGGGAGSQGVNASSGVGGSGGAGTYNNITGVYTYYAGGGGGGAVGTAGGGGSGGGGAGGQNGAAGSPGTDGLGGGGGGGCNTALLSYAGGDGGSGIIIIEYTVNPPAAPTNVAATDGTYTNTVVITWTKSTCATNYYVYEGSNLIASLGDVATYNDSAAPAPTIIAGVASATDGTYSAYIQISISGVSAVNGSSRTYKVMASGIGGNSSYSSTDTGYRGTTTLTYQWSRSSADSDASYSNIGGGTTNPYNDTGAPCNGDGRYFKCNVSMTDATMNTTNADRGYETAILSISNTPSSKAFGYVNPNSSYWSNGSVPTFPLTDAKCFFTFTSNGSCSQFIYINASSFTGGTGWTVTNGSPGSNSVRIKAFRSGDASEGLAVILENTAKVLYPGVSNGSYKWEIKLETGTFTDGLLKTGIITLTALAN